MKKLFFICSCVCVLLCACAGERQGLVCEEMEYRLNTMAYSPDQRAYAEEELRVCREEEAQKKAAGAAERKSIYDRFAASDSTKSQEPLVADSVKKAEANEGISVSNALKDSSGQETVSIYERYGSKTGAEESSAAETIKDPAESVADTSASDAANFQ
ncbi:MAG: hypothetical protein MJY98_02800 [Fibrobacter sp.]|nr:hypothetical protein [Fibrobacter sp.]